MRDISLILMAAGDSTRFGRKVKKQWLRVGEKPLWEFAADRFYEFGKFDGSDGFAQVIIAAAPAETALIASLTDYTVISGGATRAESLANALCAVKTEFVLVSDAARALISRELVQRVIAHKGQADCVAPALASVDTLADRRGAVINRENTVRVQTPQLSRTAVLRSALAAKSGFSDESTLIAACNGSVLYVAGEDGAAKLTFGGELEALEPPSQTPLIGYGFDAHAFEAGKPCVLCGVKIDGADGFKAHSDGDAALHALIDAILGACGLGDIGQWFPDHDPHFKNADSAELLRTVISHINRFGFAVVSADITIMAEKPRLEPHKIAMRKEVARLLGVRCERVNIKATTTEKLGFVGRKEGAAVSAIAAVRYCND
ncbi:bifunctional enzyme IspD/IspF [Campylobacterota bacterium]|nr:bifunctional enzyme IspD/IspF [Campylobacterota bacterium]